MKPNLCRYFLPLPFALLLGLLTQAQTFVPAEARFEWYNGIAFDAEGTRMAVTSVTPQVFVYQTSESGGPVGFSGFSENAIVSAFSPDGRFLAAGSWDHSVRVWDTQGEYRTNIFRVHSGAVYALDWSENGQYIATGGFDGTIHITDFHAGKAAAATYRGHTGNVAALEFSQDGKMLASGAWDKQVILWNTDTGAHKKILSGHEGAVSNLAFSKDEKYLAVADDLGHLYIWDTASAKLLKKFENRYEPGHNVFFNFGCQIYVADVKGRPHYVLNPFWEKDKHSAAVRSRPGLKKRLAERNQFETDLEYLFRKASASEALAPIILDLELEEARRRASRIAASRKQTVLPASEYTLGEYSIEDGIFPFIINGDTLLLQIDRKNARTLYEGRSQMRVEAVEQLTADLETKEYVNLRVIHPFTGYTYNAGPQVDFEALPSIAVLPARPEVVDIVFTDSDGDNRLSAGEHAVVEFTVTNKGEGPAQTLRIIGDTDADISGLAASLGTLAPGDSRHVSLPISGGENLGEGNAEISFSVLELNGFHADPFRIVIPTAPYAAPLLEIADVGVSDASGRAVITPGNVTEITVRVLNKGLGHAADVQLRLTPGEGVFLAETPNPKEHTAEVGSIAPGAFRDVTFRAFANNEAAGFPVEAEIIEQSGKYRTKAADLGLDVMNTQRSMRELIVSARALRDDRASDRALTSDVSRDIPQAEAPNPDAVAVIIGNRSYRDGMPAVSFALNDAVLMRTYAEQAFGIRPGNILYLEDATLTNMNVIFGDANNPRGRLSDLVKTGRSDVFVFYSGHGAPDPNSRRAYLMPVDSDASRLDLTAYSLEVLYANLAELGARSVTVVVDACFSGASGGGDMLIAEASPIGIRINDPSAVIGENAVVITASSGQQIASWYPEMRHGLLTYFFLKGIQGAADATGDGQITAGEMEVWLTDRNDGLPYTARRLHSRDQTPQVWGDRNILLR